MKKQKSKPYTFGILTTLEKDIFRSRYHTEILSGVFAEAFRKGYEMKLFSMQKSRYSKIGDLLKDHQIDGLLVLAWRWISPHLIELLESSSGSLPVVLFNDFTEDIKTNMVYTDVRSGAKSAVNFLVRKGYKKIGMLRGPKTISFLYNKTKTHVPFVDAHQKFLGFIEGLKENGMTCRKDWIKVCRAYREDYAYQNMRLWLRGKDYPEAVLCGNDDVALGALKAIHDSGLACPKDVALIGFDNTEKAGSSTPPLTTIAQPLHEMGCEAVKILTRKIENKLPQPVWRVFPSRLISRASA